VGVESWVWSRGCGLGDRSAASVGGVQPLYTAVGQVLKGTSRRDYITCIVKEKLAPLWVECTNRC
jgi:hypothetical protein